MSTIDETEACYVAVCRDLNIEPHLCVSKMLAKEKDESLFHHKDNMLLYLAGNNRRVNKEKRLNDRDALALYKTLEQNSYVVILDLRYNNITDEGAKHIASLLQETVSLKSLNLMCNDFREEGGIYLAKAMQINQSLVSLRVNGNKFGDKGGLCFAQALQTNTTLEDLDVAETDMKTGSIIAMATVLNHNTTILSINLSRPILFSQQEETTVHFARMLKTNRTLRELHLSKYDMRDVGANWLAENLVENLHLTHLDLRCNRITSDGAEALARYLKLDPPLGVLQMGFNRVGNDGVVHFADALTACNTQLHTLELVNNELSGRGLCALANSLKVNRTLVNLYVWGNDLDRTASIAFAHLFKVGRFELKNCDVKPYVVDGVTFLGQLNNGVKKDYYWAPYYGDQAAPELQP